MLRLAFVLTIVAFGAAYAVRSPFYALLLYLWVAYFRPDYWIGWMDLIWQMKLSLLTGSFVLVSTVLTGQKFRFGTGPFLWFVFFVLSFVSVLNSVSYEYSFIFWRNFAPALVFGYLIVVLVTDERRLRLVLIVMSFSLAFEAAKQGWIELVSNPGGVNLNDNLMLGDNNGVAVGMLMLLPILLALAQTSKGNWERLLHRFLAVGVLYRALTTYSRGGFLACATLGVHYLLHARRKLPAVVGIVVVSALLLPALPSAFWERMQSINVSRDRLDSEDTDGSIRGRIHFWRVALVMAADRPLTGVGFSAFNPAYNRYDFSGGAFGTNKSVHSTWLGLLTELGYPGLIVFLGLLFLAFRACRRMRRLAKRDPEYETLGIYATAVESALLVFVVGGTFVIFHYVEMMWHFLALSIVINRFVNEREAALALTAAQSCPRPSIAPRVRPSAAAVGPTRRRLASQE